jgi:hypothetical protein
VNAIRVEPCPASGGDEEFLRELDAREITSFRVLRGPIEDEWRVAMILDGKWQRTCDAIFQTQAEAVAFSVGLRSGILLREEGYGCSPQNDTRPVTQHRPEQPEHKDDRDADV